MKIFHWPAIIIAISYAINAPAIADHKHGARNECWRDSKYNKHWAYYFCGAQKNICDGKKSKGHDTVFWQYDGDSFTFTTDPKETHYCCGGTKTTEGKYIKSDAWIVKTETTRMAVEGGTCNKLIQTDACGNVHETECDTPDTCNAGLTLRNGACVAPCGEGEVFESFTSNTCIKCEDTPYQGIAVKTMTKKVGIFKKRTIEIKYDACFKCDKDTEFFDRQTKQCIPKSSMNRISQEALKACWRCPTDIQKDCVMEMNKPEHQRGYAATDWAGIQKRCHIE